MTSINGTQTLNRVGQVEHIDFSMIDIAPEFRAFLEPLLTSDAPETAGPDDGPETAGVDTPTLDVVLSAAAPAKLQLGKPAEIRVRIEVTAGATPFDERVEATIDETKAIMVNLLAHGDSVTD
ncbi:MAG: hypothetical protein R2845_09350 [Thermomicrobiales bacterium]